MGIFRVVRGDYFVLITTKETYILHRVGLPIDNCIWKLKTRTKGGE